MTLSLLLNNGKLALAGSGKLPQSSSCCCDTPCFCPDLCRYRICVVEPSEIAVCSQYVGCGSGNPGNSSVPLIGLLYPCLHPLTLDGWAEEGFCNALCYAGDDCDPNDPFYVEPLSGSKSFADRQEASVTHIQVFYKCPGCVVDYSTTTTLSLVCTAGGWFADVEFRATYLDATLFIKRTGSISLPSACESCRGDSGNCNTPPANCRVLQTPFTITANGQTTSLGEYTYIDEFEVTNFDENDPCDRELVYLAIRGHVLGASATFRIEARDACAECCCGNDGSITETDRSEPCSGQIVSKPAETCNWDDVTITFTVCGVSATASASDWANGIEPEFTAGQGAGNGTATGTCLRRDNGYGEAFTYNYFTFDTAGAFSCTCNLRSMYFFINLSLSDITDPNVTRTADCYYDLTINECLNEPVLLESTTLPDGQCCPDGCVIECEVNWAP